QNVEFAALPIASWLSASNVDALPHTSLFRLLKIVSAEDGYQAVGKAVVAALPPNPTIEDLPKITWEEPSLRQRGFAGSKRCKGQEELD
ncbi:hypothetical protein ACKRZS_004369, partial [Fusarium odoratissimum]